MDFDLLPLEIKYQILSYLTPSELRLKFGSVCKDWKQMSDSPYLRSELEIDAKILSPEEIVRRLSIHNRVRVVKFINVTDWRWLYLIGLPKRTFVRTLEFVKCLVSPQVGRYFPNIREVKTSSSHPRDHGTAFDFGAKSFQHIEVLQLDEATIPKYNAWHFWGIQKYKDLKKLRAHAVVLNSDVTTFCRKLIHVELFGAQEMTHDQFISLKYLTNLQTLHISYGIQLPDEAFGNLLVLNTFPHLSALSFDTFRALTDYGVEMIAKGCSFLTKLRLSNCEKITDQGVEQISRYCRDLEELDLSGCYALTGKFLYHYHVTSYLRSLRYLNLKACYQITPCSIESLLEEKPNLTIVRPEVSRC